MSTLTGNLCDLSSLRIWMTCKGLQANCENTNCRTLRDQPWFMGVYLAGGLRSFRARLASWMDFFVFLTPTNYSTHIHLFSALVLVDMRKCVRYAWRPEFQDNCFLYLVILFHFYTKCRRKTMLPSWDMDRSTANSVMVRPWSAVNGFGNTACKFFMSKGLYDKLGSWIPLSLKQFRVSN